MHTFTSTGLQQKALMCVVSLFVGVCAVCVSFISLKSGLLQFSARLPSIWILFIRGYVHEQ